MLLLLACTAPDRDPDTGVEPDPVDLVEALTSPGPYAVGYRVETVTYPDSVAGGERTLRLARWYPTDDTSGDDATYDGLLDAPGVWEDAHEADGDFPLAVFSHGHQGYAENSGFLMAHLASHGWRVAAPDHTGNTIFDGADRDDAIYLQRPRDISAVLDAVGATAADYVVGLGHSFGGYTMLALAGATYDPEACGPCATYPDVVAAGVAEPRLDAIVAMAPGDFDLFGADGLAAATTPLLHMTATEDAPGDDTWNAIAGGGNLHVSLVGGGHQSFTDYADELEDVPLDRDEGFRIVDAYVLAWARYYGGDTTVAPVLDGTRVVSDAAVLER